MKMDNNNNNNNNNNNKFYSQCGLQFSLRFSYVINDFLNISRMGIPITHVVYMPWHLGDPLFTSTNRQTHRMVFTMMVMIFHSPYAFCYTSTPCYVW